MEPLTAPFHPFPRLTDRSSFCSQESLTDRLEKLKTVAFVRVNQASKSVLTSVRAVKCQTRDYILYKVDAWLTAHVPHGVRYFVFFSVAQVRIHKRYA